MIYRILGEMAIEAEEGTRLSLPGGHQLTVLAVLLVNANKRVPAADLLRAAWGSTAVSLTQLHKSVSSLRRILALVGRGADLVTHQGYGYELRVAEKDLDRLVFERLIRDADRAGAERSHEQETELLREALRLWTGPSPLAGVTGPFQREIAHLQQRRKRAAVRLFDLELARGRAAQIIDDLYTMVGYHLTDRRLTEQLMLALYRCGHATDALQVYDRHATALEDEAGASPEQELRSLRYAIASSNERVIAQRERAGTTAQRPLVPRQLPADTADLVGRDEAVAEGVWLLGREPRAATPVVVVTGPGGIGKTALAVHIAHQVRDRYPDGQLFVELSDMAAQHLAPDELLAQVLRGFEVSKVPDTRAERAAMYRTLLGERRVLLVLDDARDEAQIRDLIPGNPACGVLVTARQRLPDIDGAHHLPSLGPLEQREATAMFQRAVQRCGVDPDAEPEATERVVQLCAGLPLALAIVAALRGRDPGRSTADIANRLAQQRLDGFVYGDRSVALSINVGFDRLDAQAQQLFIGLGLLRLTDFTLWTAAAILHGSEADPAEVLLRLAESHMIQPTGQPMRYRFHDLTRQYARHRAEREHPAADERRAVVERVYGGLLTLTRRAHRGIYSSAFDQLDSAVAPWSAPPVVLADLDNDTLVWYEAERANVRAAVRHSADLGLSDLCWELAASAHEFYTLQGYFDDWHATHRLALDACRAAGNQRGEAATTVLLAQPALVASNRANVPTVADLTRAAAIFEQLGDQHGHAIALLTLANAHRRRGEFDRALPAFVQALRLYEASDDPVGRWQALRYIGQTHLNLGDAPAALRVLGSAYSSAHETGQSRLIAQTAYWIGHVHLYLGALAEAEATFQQVLDLVGSAPDIGRAYATHGLGEVALRGGALDEAETHLTTAATLARTALASDAVLEGRVYQSLAELRRVQARPSARVDALKQAVSCFDRGNATYLHARALHALGEAHAAQGANGPARAAWMEAVARYTELDLPEADEIRQRLSSLAEPAG